MGRQNHLVTPEDVGAAGRGDLSALRRLRDYWLRLATGECVNPALRKEDVLPQMELLAELAAGSGEAQDHVALITAYQVRAEALEQSRGACADMAKETAQAGNSVGAQHWSREVADFDDRLRRYRAQIDALHHHLLTEGDASGAAILVTALTLQADRGDEFAVATLQCVMDSVTPERASAIQAEVRKIEKETTQ